jgi:RNA polymerase sigma factor (TIGR02999 family)
MEPVDDGHEDITRLLIAWRQGRPEALDRLTSMVYGELHRLAHHYLRDERRRPLQTTELVHEAFLRLVGSEVEWQGRTHFYVVAARQMRRILVDLARRRAAQRRGGDVREITLVEGEVADDPPVDVLALDEALRDLAAVDQRKCRVIELSYFAGLTIPAIAEGLEISTATVERDLRTARAWLAKTLRQGSHAGDRT